HTVNGVPVVTARLVALTLLTAAVAGRSAAAQVGATTDIITGKVTGPDSQPLAGAVVVATSVETRVSRQRTSDANGRFTIVFPDGGGRYELTARFIGMAAVQVNLARQADEDRIVANIRMGLAAVPLEPVPQDAVRSIRVVTNSYDVARGQFSGGLVVSTTRGGTNVPQGAFTYSLRDRSLEWGEVTSSPFGQGMTQNQLGGGMGGPIVPN